MGCSSGDGNAVGGARDDLDDDLASRIATEYSRDDLEALRERLDAIDNAIEVYMLDPISHGGLLRHVLRDGGR